MAEITITSSPMEVLEFISEQKRLLFQKDKEIAQLKRALEQPRTSGKWRVGKPYTYGTPVGPQIACDIYEGDIRRFFAEAVQAPRIVGLLNARTALTREQIRATGLTNRYAVERFIARLRELGIEVEGE